MGTTAFKCVLGGAAVGIVGISGTVGVLFGAGWGTLAFAAQVTAVYCGVVIVWNPFIPDLIEMVTGMRRFSCTSSRSGAQRDCAYDAATMADWDALAAGKPSIVSAGQFYAEYHSHQLSHLVRIRKALASGDKSPRFVYLMGDSSLDNKHWFFDGFRSKSGQMDDPEFTAEAVNGFEGALQPPRMVQDVCYWMNAGAAQRLGSQRVCTIMTSVEESTIEGRMRGGLLAQDMLVRDHLTSKDAIVLSVGGNDIALRPTLRTAINMLLLTKSPAWMIKAGIAPGYRYFVNFLHSKIRKFLAKVVAKTQPAVVLVCMIYYPCEVPGGSWADGVLGQLGYDANPAKLQLVIRSLFKAIQKKGIRIPGAPSVPVVPVPLFSVLDPSNPADYEQRVEPSVQGGHKMAERFLDDLLPHLGFAAAAAAGGGGAGVGAGASEAGAGAGAGGVRRAEVARGE